MNADDITLKSVDPKLYRTAMGAFATGVAVVTTRWDGAPHGMTMNSLTSVSLDPCMLLICPRRGSTTGTAIARRRAFVVNVLERDQSHLSDRFVGAFGERFAGLDMIDSPAGLPMIDGAIAHIGCRVAQIHEAGDHDVVIGEVEFCQKSHGRPLVFHEGLYRDLAHRD